MLEKRLELGGLQVGSPRTTQNSARFRVADNVYQTRDNYFVPRWRNSPLATMPKAVYAMATYNEKLFYLLEDGAKLVAFYEGVEFNGVDIPKPPAGKGIQFVEKQGCIYFHLPTKGLWKFDGVRAYRAGVPSIYYSFVNAHASDYSEAYGRVIVSHFDFQGNKIQSGYSDVGHKFRYKTGDTELEMYVPEEQGLEDNLLPEEGFPAYGIRNIASVTNDNVAGTVTVTAPNTFVRAKVGERLYYYSPYSTTLSSGDVFIQMISYEILSYVADSSLGISTVTLGQAKILVDDEWRDWNYATDGNLAQIGMLSELGNYFASLYVSGSSTGEYVRKDIIPIFIPYGYSPAFKFNFDGNVNTPIGVSSEFTGLSPILGDTYDETSSKILFPAKSSNCFTLHSDKAYVSYDHEIYYSDSTQGGNFEMTEGLSFMVVGERDEGKVVSICGTEDFIFVSRQRKNYSVTGNIPTSNYSVNEVANTSLGCLTNESSINYGASVFFINSNGVWMLGKGSDAKEISASVRGFFSDFSDTPNFAEELKFDIEAFHSNNSLWMKLRKDISRGLIAFVVKGAGEGSALVLNVNNGEFYTWNNLAGIFAPGMSEFIFWEGNYYLAVGTKVAKENKSLKTFTEYKPKLTTTWVTIGEPSLDKKITQIKMWGILNGIINISQFMDWKDNAVFSKAYSSEDKFSNKFRLDSMNCLTGSVEMVFNEAFYLEGLEIEFSVLQEGMKK